MLPARTRLVGSDPGGISRNAVSGHLPFARDSAPNGSGVFADLVGKGGHIRTVPVPFWIETALRVLMREAKITAGPIFGLINKAGRIAPHGFSPHAIWSVVKRACCGSDISGVAPRDLRRTCARLCHEAGGELEQIQFLLGHVSVPITERYLGCKQRLR